MKGVQILLNSPVKPEISTRLPYSGELSLCVVILGSHLSAVTFIFQGKSEVQWQEANGWTLCPWKEGRAREVHIDPKGVCHLSLASCSTMLYSFAQDYV